MKHKRKKIDKIGYFFKLRKELDEVDRKIMLELFQDGRKSFVDIAKRVDLTSPAVRDRIKKLFEGEIIRVSALTNPIVFYSVSASLGIETDAEGISMLIDKLQNCPFVFHMMRVSGNHNLIIGMVAPNLNMIERIINKQIRSEPGIKHVEVNIGNLPIIPKFLQLRIPDKKLNETPCGVRCDECKYYKDGLCEGCPVTIWYKG